MSIENVVEIPGGFKVPADQLMAKWQLETGRLDHDFFLIPLACAHIPPGGIVIDAGAMAGDHSIAYARKVGKEGTVIAIEAGKLSFECLSHNAQKFESTVICINAALSDEHGSWCSHHINEANMGGSIVTTFDGVGEKIWTATIDGIMKDGKIPRLDFIKIDCEGWELKILKGAGETIRTFRPPILLEMNFAALQAQGASYEDVRQTLRDLGYGWHICQPELKGDSHQYDLICLPLKPKE